jgi:hypothetical protein
MHGVLAHWMGCEALETYTRVAVLHVLAVCLWAVTQLLLPAIDLWDKFKIKYTV